MPEQSPPAELAPVLELATPSLAHGFLMPTAAVADGYGVDPSTIRGHKKARPDELLEHQHWLKDEQGHIQWTARGVIQLGFCTQSKQGEAFRRWAESRIMAPVGETNAVPTPYSPEQIQAVAWPIADAIHQQRQRHRQSLEAQVNSEIAGRLQQLEAEAEPVDLGKAIAQRWGLELAQVLPALGGLVS